jgi:hypothetical protein
LYHFDIFMGYMRQDCLVGPGRYGATHDTYPTQVHWRPFLRRVDIQASPTISLEKNRTSSDSARPVQLLSFPPAMSRCRRVVSSMSRASSYFLIADCSCICTWSCERSWRRLIQDASHCRGRYLNIALMLKVDDALHCDVLYGR